MAFSIQLLSQTSIHEIIISDSAIGEQFQSLERIDENLYCIYNKNDTTNPYGQYQSRLLRIEPDFDTTWLDFDHIDSTIHFSEMIVNNSGNLLLAGHVYFQSGLRSKAHWFCEVTPDMSIIWEKGYKYEVDSISTRADCLGQFVDGDYLYVTNLRNLETSEVYMYAIKISEQGDSISNHIFDISVTGRVNSITPADTNLTLHIEHADYGSPYRCKLHTIDSKYNTLSFVPYPITIFSDPFYTIINSEGNYLSLGSYWFLGDYYLKAITFDTINGLSYNVNHTSGEEEVYPAWHKGIDFYYDNHIFIAGMYNVQTHWQEFPNTFYIACLSQDLSLKHEIVLGGEQYYNVFDITATSTGGVAIVGTIYDPYSYSYQHDAYLAIIDSVVFVGQPEYPVPISNLSLEIYPNPGTNVINIKSEDESSQIEIFNTSGQKVYSAQCIDEQVKINVSQWSRGIYFIKLSTPNQQVITDTFIKN